jgi:23S rRNA pseudouridine1911/1915/1917 synthase
MEREQRDFSVTKSLRLDKAVAMNTRPLVSRTLAQRLIELGEVTVNGAPQDASYMLKPGEVVRVLLPLPEPKAPVPEDIPLDILYEDPDVIAINKPAGMVVHPGVGNKHGTLVSAVLHLAPEIAGLGDEERPGVVHRLDKETSGVVLVAKTDAALRALQAQFKSRAISKIYLAVCVGNVFPQRGVIDKPIARDPAHRQRMAVLAGGKEAITEYVVSDVFKLAGVGAYSLVRAHPRTGRTHQLRVHFASLGFPIVGDGLYGATKRDDLSKRLAPRHLLHAAELRFQLPSTGAELRLTAPMPADFAAALAELAAGG